MAPILVAWLFLWLASFDGERTESIPTDAEIEADLIQNTEFVNEGPADWRKNIPVVGPSSTSTDHLK